MVTEGAHIRLDLSGTAHHEEATGPEEAVFRLRDVSVAYDGRPALRGVTLDIPRNRITAIIGPSGCGKSTLIRCLNRMNDLIPGAEVRGQVLYHGQDLYDPAVDPVEVRRHIGMVFQKPNPFPKSVFDNVAAGLRLTAVNRKADARRVVERSLRAAALWDEVKDKLDAPGLVALRWAAAAALHRPRTRDRARGRC
ncbi:MAG: hypothetical protein KatS3mg014_0089 [Actinomycetota bacterium]|nr:MAG: hypothetical protein KatS3mg014_0089 [Actinomycetota bacterium]